MFLFSSYGSLNVYVTDVPGLKKAETSGSEMKRTWIRIMHMQNYNFCAIFALTWQYGIDLAFVINIHQILI